MKCPFCGDEGAIDELGTGSHPVYAVICQGCGAVGPASEDPAAASRAWDHRPPHEHGLPFLPRAIVRGRAEN